MDESMHSVIMENNYLEPIKENVKKDKNLCCYCCMDITPCCLWWFFHNNGGFSSYQDEDTIKNTYCSCLNCCPECIMIKVRNCCFKEEKECLCCFCTFIFEKT